MSVNRHTIPWWQRGVVYQIYPRSFKDTTGNGIGDLGGIIEKLDYLNGNTQTSLGIDAIWISPFYPSPMADFGYDVSDYCNIDPLFGDLAAFDRLVREAHRRDIKIIIDFVPNHSSDQHPWFIEARRSRDSLKRDWYIWRDPKPDGSPPNNWGSFFGGPAWTLDKASGQYYLHQFLSQQPELNWRNPKVVEAMFDILRFWLARGVDGFRMDVIHLIIKDAQLRDNPPNPEADPNLPPYDLFGRLQSVYNLDQDEIHTYLRRIRKVLDEYDRRCAIGELWGELPRWVRYYGQQGDELHMPFNFRLMRQPWDALAIRQSVDELEAVLPPFAWPNYVLGNHDQGRLATRFGGQGQARLAAMLLLTLRGTPTLYYGDELGIENGSIPPNKIQDPQGRNLGAERSRDIARTPMQWDGSPNAGFSEAEPWLPVSKNYAHRNVSAQAGDPQSILSLYRNLLGLRRGSPALHSGSYQPQEATQDSYAFIRQYAGECKLIALNFSSQKRSVCLPDIEGAQVLLSTHLDRAGENFSAIFELRAYEGIIADI